MLTGLGLKVTPSSGEVGVAPDVKVMVPAKPLVLSAPEGWLPRVMVAVPVDCESIVREEVDEVMLKSWTLTVTVMLFVFDCPPAVAAPRMLTV